MLFAIAKHMTSAKAAIAALARGIFLVLLFAVIEARAIPVYNTYAFKRNSERPIRKETRYIILHTTEGPARGSGEKLKQNGEAHYMIDQAGNIYAIVDRRRVAFHCGLSMWERRTNIDNYSIGIEMVGFHNKDLTAAQIKSLKLLIADLKTKYPAVTDERILTHSMVAYGDPNQWHKQKHRGRKRCGMNMSASTLRAKFGVKSKPSYDPDVRERRLIVADKELFNFLYRKSVSSADDISAAKKYSKTEENTIIGPNRSAWDIARDAYNSPSTTYIFPDGSKKTGDKIKEWKSMPSGTKVILSSASANNSSAKTQTDSKSNQKSVSNNKKTETRSKGNDNTPKAKEEANKTEHATNVNADKTADNVIGPNRSAWDIAKNAYNAASTVYIFPDGTRKTGAEITKWQSLRAGTTVIVADIDRNSSTNGVISAATIAMAGNAAKEIAKTIAGNDWNATNTFYITPSGKYYRGSELKLDDFAEIELNTKMLAGYKCGGPVNAHTPIFNVCGPAWNKPTTFYLFPNGNLVSGDKVDAAKVRPGTMIFFKE